MRHVNEFFKKYNVYGLPLGNTGAQMGGWFRKEDQNAGRPQGPQIPHRRHRWPSSAKARRRPAADSPAADIYPALEKGTIDAAEWIGPYDDEKLGFYKVAPYYYYPGWWEGGPSLHGFISLAKWNELPKSYQAAIINAANYANTWMLARYDAQNPAALKRLVAKGAQLRPFSFEVMEACLQATNQLWAEISAKNADFKKMIEMMVAFRNDQYLWWQVAEYTYDSFMVRTRPRG